MTDTTATRQTVARLTLTRGAIVLAALALTAATAVVDILVGPAFLAVSDVLAALFLPQDAVDGAVHAIVNAIRLPTAVMALVVGASLGTAGALMQTILGNPLASPYTLGFSAAAGFGAAVVILAGIQIPFAPGATIPLAAFSMALVAAALVYGFASMRGMTAEIMVLAGIAAMFLFQSLQSLVQYMASPEVLQEMVFWLFGSLLKSSWTSVTVAGGILAVGLAVVLPDLWKLTAMRLGDDRARSLGVNVRALRIRMFVTVALLTAGAVSFVGTIGFVGLVAPHVARMIVGEDHRYLIPMSALCGAFVMSAASIASKMISPGGIVPIGIVTAVIGVPFLFALIVRNRKVFW